MQQNKNNKVEVAIDLMGNENPPKDLVEALLALGSKIDINLFLIGSEEIFSSYEQSENISFIKSSHVIEMNDDPLYSIRRKKNSSMHLGIDLLKEKKIDAFISLGNTGALVGLSTLRLPLLPMITRPSLLAMIPTHKEPLAVLDVGAHIDPKTENFFEFALLGNAYQKAMGVKAPKVGLLNIGTEKIKGTTQIKKVFELLEKKTDHFDFIGNIEGKEIFKGNVDVVLTDGFTGNIFLKTAEGIASLILDELGQNIAEGNNKFFQDVKKRLHHAQYPGALVAGLDALVIKCHGYSKPQALIHALYDVKEMVKNKFIKKLKEEL